MPSPFLNFQNESEQNLVESLINEAVTIHSECFYYIPRKLVSPDDVFGEDRLSEFKESYEIDAYLENIPNLEGQGQFLQKYGAFIDYSATVLLTRREWNEKVGQYGQTILPNRPCEGDLLYYPLTDSLFVIKYVNDKNPYAQLGKFYTYRLTIELFQYSSEKIETGNPEIDAFESLKTFDADTDKSVWKGITDIEIQNAGYGYKEVPYIHIKSATGYGAQLKPTLDKAGSIIDVKIINPGDGYKSTDEIEIIGNCDVPAKMSFTAKTRVEHAGDSWGENSFFDEKETEYVEAAEELFGENESGEKPSVEEVMKENEYFINEAMKNGEI